MKNNTPVFIAISMISGIDVKDGFVSTSLRGLCRLINLRYGMMEKRWARRIEGSSRIEVEERGVMWIILRREIDVIQGRGNRDIGRQAQRKRIANSGHVTTKVMMGSREEASIRAQEIRDDDFND